MPTDTDRAVIEPRRGRREEPLPPFAILIFTPQDLDLFIRCFSQPPKRSHRISLVDVYTGAYDGEPMALVGPMLGAPQAVLVMEKLVALGVEKMIAVGWCGSLQAHVRIGDVVLPTGAISEEGTSAHYPVPFSGPEPSSTLVEQLREGLGRELSKIHEGLVWSTDAPYRETRGKVFAYQQKGVLAVEMEASALFTVAQYRGVELAAILVVSDELFTLTWRHGFRESGFQETREKLTLLTLRVVCSIIRSQTLIQ